MCQSGRPADLRLRLRSVEEPEHRGDATVAADRLQQAGGNALALFQFHRGVVPGATGHAACYDSPEPRHSIVVRSLAAVSTAWIAILVAGLAVPIDAATGDVDKVPRSGIRKDSASSLAIGILANTFAVILDAK